MTAREVAENLLKVYSRDAEDYSAKCKLAMNETQSARYDGIVVALSAIVSDLRRLLDDDAFDTIETEETIYPFPICSMLKVDPNQKFLWEGYILRVCPETGRIQKSIKTAPDWIGLEGNLVCDLINHPDKIIRYTEETPRFSHYET